MNIETLKIFCDLVELRSFSHTAEKHLLSQSAVSQQLAQMELNLKCQLLDRKKRPIKLTKEGQLLYQASRDILDRFEHLKSELNALKSSSGDRINVAAIFSIGMHSLPDYIKRFMVSYPNVNVHVEYRSAERVYEMILNGESDIGFVAIPKRDKRLDVYELEDEPLILACSPKHPLAQKSQVDIHQLQFENFIAFEKNTPTRTWIDNILERYNVVVRPIMEFDNIETIKRAVEINAGISIVPKISIHQEVDSGTIKALQISNENLTRPTGIIIRKGKIFGQACRYFIELLRKKAK
jgi:DNA-binding transcriptional LysR family regulator